LSVQGCVRTHFFLETSLNRKKNLKITGKISRARTSTHQHNHRARGLTHVEGDRLRSALQRWFFLTIPITDSFLKMTIIRRYFGKLYSFQLIFPNPDVSTPNFLHFFPHQPSTQFLAQDLTRLIP